MSKSSNLPPEPSTRAIDELVDRPAAAKMLGISARTLDRWHLLRQGPPRVRLGGLVRYRVAAIDEWVRSRELREPRGAIDEASPAAFKKGKDRSP